MANSSESPNMTGDVQGLKNDIQGLRESISGLQAVINTLVDVVRQHTETLKQHDDLFKQFSVRFDQMDKRFDRIEARQEAAEVRFDQMDKRFDQMDKRFDRIETRQDQAENSIQKLIELHFKSQEAFEAEKAEQRKEFRLLLSSMDKMSKNIALLLEDRVMKVACDDRQDTHLERHEQTLGDHEERLNVLEVAT